MSHYVVQCQQDRHKAIEWNRGFRRSHLSVIRGSGGEESLKGVVAGQEETGKVDQEGASNVEENEEEVHSSQTQDHIDLGNRGLSLKVVEDRVLGKLSQNVSPNTPSESSIDQIPC